MRKFAIWAAALSLICMSGSALAQSSPVCYDDEAPGRYDIEKYEVDVKSVELCTDASCSTAASVVSSTTKKNIASLDAAPFPAIDVPVGSYTHMRVTIGPDIVVAGFVVLDVPSPGSGQMVCVSKAGLSGTGVIMPSTSWVGGALGTAQDMTLTIPSNAFGSAPNGDGNFEFIIALGSTIVVQEGSAFPDIDLQFTATRDALGMFGVWNGVGFGCGAVLGTPDIKLKVMPPMSTHIDLVPSKIPACSNLVGS